MLVGVAAVTLLAGAAPAVGENAAAAEQHSIVVTGNGSVATVPDRAQVSFGVSTDADTASAALRTNAAGMSKVLAAVKAQGIASADIRTELVSLSPRYPPNGDHIVGYTATNSVSVALRNLGKAGAVIDAAVDAGANRMSGPNLVRSDETALYNQALRAAIANAKSKARTIAAASGLHLRRITDVTESGGPTPAPVTARAGTTPTTPIEPGTQLVQATVIVTFSVS